MCRFGVDVDSRSFFASGLVKKRSARLMGRAASQADGMSSRARQAFLSDQKKLMGLWVMGVSLVILSWWAVRMESSVMMATVKVSASQRRGCLSGFVE